MELKMNYRLLFLAVFISLAAISCKDSDDFVKPIEVYKNRGIIVIKEPQPSNWEGNKYIRCKTKDSVFTIRLADFDAKDLKVGDTLK